MSVFYLSNVGSNTAATDTVNHRTKYIWFQVTTHLSSLWLCCFLLLDTLMVSVFFKPHGSSSITIYRHDTTSHLASRSQSRSNNIDLCLTVCLKCCALSETWSCKRELGRRLRFCCKVPGQASELGPFPFNLWGKWFSFFFFLFFLNVFTAEQHPCCCSGLLLWYCSGWTRGGATWWQVVAWGGGGRRFD